MLSCRPARVTHDLLAVLFASFPLFHLGFNLPIVAGLLLLVQSLESRLLRRISASRSEESARSLVSTLLDIGLVMLAAGLAVMTVAIVPPPGTKAGDRPYLFWFLLVPRESSFT